MLRAGRSREKRITHSDCKSLFLAKRGPKPFEAGVYKFVTLVSRRSCVDHTTLHTWVAHIGGLIVSTICPWVWADEKSDNYTLLRVHFYETTVFFPYSLKGFNLHVESVDIKRTSKEGLKLDTLCSKI